jgi:hypothetical protein
MKRCTGCGNTDDEPLGLNEYGEQFLACCPDSNYVEMTAMQKHLEWLKGRMVVSPQMESQLLEEEKQQIIDAYETAMETDIYNEPLKVGKQYYNETFKQD